MKSQCIIFILSIFLLNACVERKITVSSVPSGASCEINGRYIGKTPVGFKYVENGKFRLSLKLDQYEDLHTGFRVKKNWQDILVLDFFAEVVPYKMQNQHEVEFELLPLQKKSHDEFLEELPEKLKEIKKNDHHE